MEGGIIELLIKLEIYDEKLYKYMKNKYINVMRSVQNLYGDFLPHRIKNIVEGIEKEISFMETLYFKRIPFLKSPVDILDNDKLFLECISIVKEICKYERNRNLVKILNAYESSKEYGSYWKRYFQECLKSFPDFIVIFPKENGIKVSFYEIKRWKLFEKL